MDSWQAIGASIVFVSMIGIIIMEWLPLTVAAMLGALLLVVSNIVTLDRAIGYIAGSHSTTACTLIDGQICPSISSSDSNF